MSSAPTVAFVGATGGCANACLVHTLRAGLHAVALVRTPQKLKDQLLAQGLTEDLIDSKLTLTQGNALDVSAVKKTLLAGESSALPSVIVSGLGGSPKVQFKISAPLQLFTLDNPNICGTAAETLCTALREIYEEIPEAADRKPHLAFVSTTGISRGPEDVPAMMRFFYHKVLAVPHVDKKRMEETFRSNMEQGDAEKRVFSGITGVRPTLLGGSVKADDAAGLEKIRVGTEEKPALGYSVKRADVGHWIFENVVGSEEKRKEWNGQMVSLTS